MVDFGAMLKPWLQLFRVPNLPTAVCDAVAGGAIAGASLGLPPSAVVRPALLAGGAELLLYMAGLADNDLADADRDREAAPDRPIPSGALSRRSVAAAARLCVLGAAFLGAAGGLPPGWWLVALALLGCIAAYNRCKDAEPVPARLVMGACRGLALLSGAAAVAGGGASFAEALRRPEALLDVLPRDPGACGAVVLAALGWTLYIAAVTRLGEDEERAEAGLGRWRYALGLPALLPLAAAVPRAGWGAAGFAACSLYAFVRWCFAVAPLGAPHGPAARRRAVGRTIGGLLFLQIGAICLYPAPALLGAAAACWAAALAVRRAWPSISGS